MTSQLSTLVAVSLIGAAATAATAQTSPQPFFSLGDVTAPSSPVGTSVTVPLPNTLFDFGSPVAAGDNFTVKWLRFNLTDAVSDELYLDIGSRFFPLTNPSSFPSTLALYDQFGALVATDSGTDPVLSFGSSEPRNGSGFGGGQNGDNLPAGRYWLAVLAGDTGSATIGQTGWAASTTTTYTLGLGTPGGFFATLDIVVGNTTPGAPPQNDDCSGALTLIDFLGTSWSGNAINASLDSVSECYPDPSVQPLKDLWFRYVPVEDGFVEVIAESTAVGTGRPYLTRFGSTCTSTALQCVRGDSLAADQPVRIAFPVTQGQTVLLALAVPADDNSSLSLQINAAVPPVTTCLADLAGAGAAGNEADGSVDGSDFIAFINSFAIGDTEVDATADVAGAGDDGLSGDGTIDGSDFIAFINAFAAGC